MPIFIEEVKTAGQKDEFIKFPWKIYKNDRNWIPPLIRERRRFLDPGKNPFFKHAIVKLYLAREEKGPVTGRIAAIINHHHNSIHKEPVGFFGLFECINDQNTAQGLFTEAGNFLRANGMQCMRGPENICVNDEVGLLIKGFEHPPVIMMPYNHPYYENLIKAYGFKKAIDWWAYYINIEIASRKVPERFHKSAEIIKRRHHVRIRTLNMNRFDEEVRKIQFVYNNAWKENWGAVPFTDEEFYHLAKDLKSIGDPELCLIAEAGDKVAGISIALPDINQVLAGINGRLLPLGIFKMLWGRRKIDMIRLTIMGVVKEFRHIGIDTCFYYETYKRCLEKNIHRCEMSAIAENNTIMNNVLEKLGARRYKTYRIYDYDL
jgi:hypothetical protein